MFCRDVLKRGIRIATTLALVAAVIVSPIRSSKSAGGISRLRQNLAIPLPKPTPPSMTSVSSPSALVKAIDSEKRGGAKGKRGEANRDGLHGLLLLRPPGHLPFQTCSEFGRFKTDSSTPPAPLLTGARDGCADAQHTHLCGDLYLPVVEHLVELLMVTLVQDRPAMAVLDRFAMAVLDRFEMEVRNRFEMGCIPPLRARPSAFAPAGLRDWPSASGVDLGRATPRRRPGQS